MVALINKKITLVVDKIGAEIKSLKYKNKELMHQPCTFWKSTSPILFPIIGRLKNGFTYIDNRKVSLDIHGIVHKQNFSLVKQTKQKLVFKFINDQTLFPYPCALYVEYYLTLNALKVSFIVENTSTRNKLFYNIGFHPGFLVSSLNETKVNFNKKEALLCPLITSDGLVDFSKAKYKFFGKTLNLTDDLFLNDALIFENIKSNKFTLTSSQSILHIRTKAFPHLAVWSVPKAEYVCLEAWSGFCDEKTSNNFFLEKKSLNVLNPKCKKQFSYIIKVEEKNDK